MTFEERSRSIRATIDPFNLDEDTQIIWAQSGERWQHSDAHATVPTWSRIQFATRVTEPTTAVLRARQIAEAEQARQLAEQRQEQKEMVWAARMGVAFVGLALWYWFLVLLPLHWAR